VDADGDVKLARRAQARQQLRAASVLSDLGRHGAVGGLVNIRGAADIGSVCRYGRVALMADTLATPTPSAPRGEGFRPSIEKVLAYGSIAYAGGFCVVAIHTARLGLPLLDLPQARYVLVGVPLAAALYLTEKLAVHFLNNLRKRLVELRSAMELDVDVSDAEAKMTVALIATLPFKFFFLPFVSGSAAKVVVAAVEALAEVASEGHKKRARQFAARLAKIGRVTDRAEGLIGLVAAVPFGILLLLLYVLRVYPIIPQTFGGGAAYRVRLLVDPAKVSAQLGSQAGFAFKWDKDGSPVLTAPLEILYNTESGLWIRRRPGRVFSLDKSAVLATLPE
jgi:hypothetical protein